MYISILYYDHPDHGVCYIRDKSGTIRTWNYALSQAQVRDIVIADMKLNGDDESVAISLLDVDKIEYGQVQISSLKSIKARWITEVYRKANDIDPDDEYTWRGLLLGFLLGAGVPLKKAQDIVLHASGNGWPI